METVDLTECIFDSFQNWTNIGNKLIEYRMAFRKFGLRKMERFGHTSVIINFNTSKEENVYKLIKSNKVVSTSRQVRHDQV